MTPRPSRLRVAWTAGRLAGRRLWGREVGAADLRLGEVLTGELDEMKGLAMKVGQIVSSLDVPLPTPVLRTMERLQTGTGGMSAAEARAVLEAGLGVVRAARFEAFSTTPVAAASIGQVHRARVEGREVAVKLQYPGIAATFRRDLGAVDRIARLASLASAVDGQALVQELARRLEEECDYLREARWQARFAAAFADEDGLEIPAVHHDLSATTVLTTDWVDAASLQAVRDTATPAERTAYAQAMIRFTYLGLLRYAAIQADPHPGNFLFRPEGTVVALDFGCVRTFEPTFIDALRTIATAVRARDMASFRAGCLALGVVGQPRRFDFDHFYAVMEHLHRPLLVPQFTFTPDYVAEGHARNGPRSPNARALAIPPPYLWVMRLQWGLWALLAQLRATGDFRASFAEALATPIEPLCAEAS